MRKKKESNMSLSGHLRELRNRVVICVVCLVFTFLVGLHFAPDLVELLTGMGEQYGYQYVYIAPQELLMQYFSVALIAALCIAFPVIAYNIWAFMKPGLRKNENFLIRAALVCGLGCFVIGVLFAYYIMIPFMLHFLIDLSRGSDITASISVQSYLTFLFSIFLIFGIIFELPVMSVVLTQVGILKTKWMRKGRKLIVICIFVISSLVTPTDIVSQIMVAIPMIALYEVSILISSALLKLRKKKQQDEEDI